MMNFGGLFGHDLFGDLFGAGSTYATGSTGMFGMTQGTKGMGQGFHGAPYGFLGSILGGNANGGGSPIANLAKPFSAKNPLGLAPIMSGTPFGTVPGSDILGSLPTVSSSPLGALAGKNLFGGMRML